MASHFENHSYTGFEPLQAFDVVYGGHFEHRLLSPGRAAMTHLRLSLIDIRIETGRYDFPVIAKGTMPKGMVCIGFVAEGIHVTRYNTRQCRDDEIQVYGPGADLMYHATGGSRWINFMAPIDHLQSLGCERAGYPVALPEDGIASIPISPARRCALQELVDDGLALASALHPRTIDDVLAREISRAISSAYVDALLDAEARGKTGKESSNEGCRRVVAACEREMLAIQSSAFDLREVSRRTGHSLRSMERAFRAGVGMTPGRWFRNIRLNGALRDLLAAAPGCTITDTAARWGFKHLSRFAQSYQYAFGEPPSVTLRRARGG